MKLGAFLIGAGVLVGAGVVMLGDALLGVPGALAAAALVVGGVDLYRLGRRSRARQRRADARRGYLPPPTGQ